MKALLKLGIVALLGTSIVSAGIALTNTEKVEETANAAAHPGAYADYTYSGSYYNSIDFTLSEGLNGELRKALTTKICPTSWPVYSGTSSDKALAFVLQEADEDPTNSNNMVYFYTRDSKKKNAASDWNREHVWPQSLSSTTSTKNWGTGEAGTDLLHLRPTYNDTNGKRGNDKYGNVDGSWITYNGYEYGKSANGYFEPLDSVKGDCARIIMYVWTAYKNKYSTLPDVTKVFESYDVLMQWHMLDAPDALEGVRNDYAESSFQHNRNPFVDHPELAWKIFGDSCSASVKTQAQTTYPAAGTKTISNLSVSGTPSKKTYSEGETFSSTGVTITATYSDSTTENVTSKVTWTPSPLTAGTTSVTGTYKGKTVTVSGLTVNAASVTGITINGQTTSFKTGSTFSFGGTVTAQLDNGLTKNVTDQSTFTGYNLSTAGNYTVTVTYQGFTATYGITVTDAVNGPGYTIQFKDMGSDGSAELNALGISNLVSSGSEYISSFTNASKVYQGKTGLKMGSGSASGSLTINLSTSGTQNVSAIKVSAAKYGSDSASLSVKTNLNSNATTFSPGTSVTTEEISLDGELSTIELTTTKRVYLSAIEVVGSGTSTVNVTGVTVNKSEVELEVGETETIVATVLPENATNKNVTWETIDDSIASVEDGVITAIGSGATVVTVTTEDGEFSQDIVVTVNGGEPTLVSIDVSNAAKTEYTIGDTFVAPTILAYYSNDVWDTITTGVTFTGYDMSTAGTQTVTATYEGKTATYTITVSEPALSYLTLEDVVFNFKVGDTFVGPRVIANYSNGLTTDVTNSATFTGYDMSTAGQYTVTVSYGGEETTYSITVTATSTVQPYTIQFKQNGSHSGGELTSLTDYITSGSQYVSSISKTGQVYEADEGFRLGTKNAIASVTLNLSVLGQINVKGFKVTCKKWGSDIGELTVTSNLHSSQSILSIPSTSGDVEVTVSGKLTSITISTTTGRAIVGGVTVIPDTGSVQTVDVTGISLNKTTHSLSVNDSFTLTPTISPSDATNKGVTWTSSDEEVATVTAGTVNALSEGTTTITATTDDGGFTATCVVTVTAAIADHGKSITDPLTPSEAIAKIDGGDTSTSYYVAGIVSSIQTAWSDQYSNISVWIKPLDESNVSFELYRAGTSNSENPNLKAGDTVYCYGQLTKYNSTYETKQGGIIEKVITVEEKATAYAKTFNSANVCGTNDNTPAIASVWADMKVEYNKLDSYTKNYLSTIAVIDESDADIIEAVTRYDMVVSKRSGFEDFMSRNGGPSSNIIRTASSGTATVVACIALISFVGLAYFYYRKKRLVK